MAFALDGFGEQLDHASLTVRHVLGDLRWFHGCPISLEDWRLLFREAGSPGGSLQDLDPLPCNPRFMHPRDIGQ